MIINNNVIPFKSTSRAACQDNTVAGMLSRCSKKITVTGGCA
jgi:hypothetical protein